MITMKREEFRPYTIVLTGHSINDMRYILEHIKTATPALPSVQDIAGRYLKCFPDRSANTSVTSEIEFTIRSQEALNLLMDGLIYYEKAQVSSLSSVCVALLNKLTEIGN